MRMGLAILSLVSSLTIPRLSARRSKGLLDAHGFNGARRSEATVRSTRWYKSIAADLHEAFPESGCLRLRVKMAGHFRERGRALLAHLD